MTSGTVASGGQYWLVVIIRIFALAGVFLVLWHWFFFCFHFFPWKNGFMLLLVGVFPFVFCCWLFLVFLLVGLWFMCSVARSTNSHSYRRAD